MFNIVGYDHEQRLDPDVLLFAPFTDSFNDLSFYGQVPVVQDNWTLDSGRAKILGGGDPPNTIVYSDDCFQGTTSPETKSYTMEFFLQSPPGNGSAAPCPLWFILDGAGPVVDSRFSVFKQTTGDYNRLRLAFGSTDKLITTGTITDDTEQHICVMFQGSADGTPHVWVHIDGVLAGEISSPDADSFHLPSSGNAGNIWLGGGPSVAPIYWDSVRLKLGLQYNTAGFTPPSKADITPYI